MILGANVFSGAPNAFAVDTTTCATPVDHGTSSRAGAAFSHFQIALKRGMWLPGKNGCGETLNLSPAPLSSWHCGGLSSHREQKKTKTKTYSSRDSHVVTHRSTNLPFNCLCMAERTGCPVFS
ncbi:hypothetical protein KCU64_g1432, partial [Aureobasidium melanogenum]